MRGTHSEGFTLRANAPAAHLLPQPYERIHAQTMVPFAHLLWGSVWAGIAAVATAHAQAFVRHAVRQLERPDAAGSGAFHAGGLLVADASRGARLDACAATSRRMKDERAVTSLEFQSTITLTKVAGLRAGRRRPCSSALRACGLVGLSQRREFSIGRHLRDVLSAPIMINNDRILAESRRRPR